MTKVVEISWVLNRKYLFKVSLIDDFNVIIAWHIDTPGACHANISNIEQECYKVLGRIYNKTGRFDIPCRTKIDDLRN